MVMWIVIEAYKEAWQTPALALFKTKAKADAWAANLRAENKDLGLPDIFVEVQSIDVDTY